MIVRTPDGFIHMRDTKVISWSWSTLLAGAGTDFLGGGYVFGATDSDFAIPVVHGTANRSYASHAFIVVGAVPAADVTISCTGTTINDQGVRVAAGSEDIVIPSGTAVGTYIETAAKWLGECTFTLTAGPATACNYGYAKYWDNNNHDFSINGIEATGEGFATDAAVDLQVIHHRATGWAFNAGAIPTYPTAVASMAADHGVDSGVQSGQEFAWKRDNLSTIVRGGDGEGVIFASITSVVNSINGATISLVYTDIG